jgi:hypothetical protein
MDIPTFLRLLYKDSAPWTYFPKLGLCDLHAVCGSVNSPPPPPPINFWMPETIFVKLGMYHGNWAHLNGVLNKS